MNDERRLNSLQNQSFAHNMFNLVVLKDEFLAKNFHRKVSTLRLVFANKENFAESALTQDFDNFEISWSWIRQRDRLLDFWS